MKEGFIDEIKSKGYWRINVRPLTRTDHKLALGACKKIVQQASVELRGWDYPHIPHNESADDTGIEIHDNFIRGWVDWSGHKEFWHMYSSGQFLHYRALIEDWRDYSNYAGSINKRTPALGLISNLWLLVEIFEFVSRLVEANKEYAEGALVSITLFSGDEPRTLWIEDSGRVPFSYPRTTNAKSILYTVTLDRDAAADPKTSAMNAARHFFDKFSWDPSDDQLMSDIEKLYRP